jgi:hypothetical protein
LGRKAKIGRRILVVGGEDDDDWLPAHCFWASIETNEWLDDFPWMPKGDLCGMN